MLFWYYPKHFKYAYDVVVLHMASWWVLTIRNMAQRLRALKSFVWSPDVLLKTKQFGPKKKNLTQFVIKAQQFSLRKESNLIEKPQWFG